MMDVDLSDMEPKASPSTRAEDLLRLNLRGALEQLQQATPAPSSPLQYITSRAQLPSTALGAPIQAGETENSPRSVGTEPVIPTLVVTLPQTSPWATPPGGSPSSAQSTIKVTKPFWLTGPRTLEAGSMPYIKWPPVSLEGEPTSLSKELLQLQEEMKTASEELLEFSASIDCQCREQDLGVELAVCHNDAQLAKAKTCHAAAAAALQQAHLDSISALNCKVMAGGKDAKLLQRNSQQPSEPVYQRTARHSCTLYKF